MSFDFSICQQISQVKDFFYFLGLLDTRIFNGINQFAGKWLWLDNLAVFLAKYFEYFLILFLLFFLVKNLKKYRPMVFESFLAAILARLGIVNLIRWLWFRPRPFLENHINLLFPYNPAEPSFPSGHAAFYFAIATVVFLYLKKVYPRPKFWWGAGVLFYIASFLISISRVFSGIHWPFDILAGAIIGIFSGWLIILFSRKLFPNGSRQLPQSV